MADDKKKKAQQAARTANVLETLKELGKDTTSEEVLRNSPQAFIDQLLGSSAAESVSGEISAGGSIEMEEVMSSKEGKEKVEKQMHFERRVYAEEKEMIEKRTNELRMQLNAIMEEVVVLTETTQELAEETQVAAMQAPVEPGVYHLVFFENLLKFLKSFRKKISEASLWLQNANNRASKKNKWGQNYKKHGAKYLLSGEHYLTRSAG